MPIYRFEVPTEDSLRLQQALVKMQRPVEDGTANGKHSGKLSFCLRASDLDNLGRQRNDLLLLSQGSWKEFLLLWAQHRLKGCRSTGSKMVYCMTPPDMSFDLHVFCTTVPWHGLTVIMSFFVCRAPAVPGDDADEMVQMGSLTQFSSTSRGAYRAYGAYRASCAHHASRGYHLAFWHGINVVGFQPKPVPRNTSEKPEPPALLFAFQNEKPDDESLKRFLGANATTLDAAISTKWVPVQLLRRKVSHGGCVGGQEHCVGHPPL